MSSAKKTGEESRSFIEAVALKHGWAVNSEEAFTNKIAYGLMSNYNRCGYYLCPCRDGEGNRARDKDIICPCAYAQADIDEYGHCFCGLYLSPEQAASGKAVASIPERRPAEYYAD